MNLYEKKSLTKNCIYLKYAYVFENKFWFEAIILFSKENNIYLRILVDMFLYTSARKKSIEASM